MKNKNKNKIVCVYTYSIGPWKLINLKVLDNVDSLFNKVLDVYVYIFHTLVSVYHLKLLNFRGKLCIYRPWYFLQHLFHVFV